MIETTATGRARRVIRGDGSVTPTRPLVVAEDGRTETLEPGRSRLSVDHPLVRRYPERFTATHAGDRETQSVLLSALRNAERTVERALGRKRTTRKGGEFTPLPSSRPEGRPTWQL